MNEQSELRSPTLVFSNADLRLCLFSERIKECIRGGGGRVSALLRNFEVDIFLFD